MSGNGTVKPSIGRIVHYVDTNGVEQPAIITRVWTRECVNLQVLPDCAAPRVEASVVENDAVHTPFSWHWPERE